MTSTGFAMPRVLAWEVTRRCPLRCRHCRAAAADRAWADELTSGECAAVIDSLPAGTMIIWTGGEPMSRPDLVELVSRATARGLRSVLAPCGMLVTEANMKELKDAGVAACSFSMDGPDASVHDAFRGVEGAFDKVIGAMAAARKAGMPFQVNVTVTKLDVDRLEEIRDRAIAEGASKLDLFFLVPTGRGKAISDLAVGEARTAEVIEWMKGPQPIPMKATCCPRGPTGCLGGRGFAFLSHVGNLQTCGFVDIPCGNIRDHGCDFRALVAAASNPLGECGNCRSLAARERGDA